MIGECPADAYQVACVPSGNDEVRACKHARDAWQIIGWPDQAGRIENPHDVCWVKRNVVAVFDQGTARLPGIDITTPHSRRWHNWRG